MHNEKKKRKTLYSGSLSGLLPVLHFFSFFCFLSSTGFSQTSASTILRPMILTGRVEDSLNQTLLSSVTLIVHDVEKKQSSNSALSTENGLFEIKLFPQKQYVLEISHVGYHSKTIKLYFLHSATANLGAIALVPLTKGLKEVQVTTVKPLIEYDADKLTYNVDSDPESRTAAALDILRKVPFLSLDAEDNLQLNGNDNYRILINGKRSSLFLRNQGDLLKNLSACAIKAIEVMTVPPSRYEAQGIGGIINIVTHQKTVGGYSGGVNLQASQPKGVYTNGNITAGLGKISFSGNGGYNSSTTPESISTSFRLDKIKQSSLEQSGSSNSSYALQNMGGELSFEPNIRNLVTLGYHLSRGNSIIEFIQQAMLFNTSALPAEANRYFNAGESKQLTGDLSLDYVHTFKNNEARQLTLYYKNGNSTNTGATDFTFHSLKAFKDQSRRTRNEEGAREQRFGADYVQPLKKHTLELGVSSVLRKSSSQYVYKNLDTTTGAFVLDTSRSNRFHYQEDIHAAYVSLNLKLVKWGLRLGARLERAKIDARFVSTQTLAIQEYRNLIPSFTVSRKLKGLSMVKLSYTQRMNRPTLEFLNPFIDLSDPWNISYGNPGLRPALAHLFDLSYNTSISKTFFNIAFLHQFTNNSIQQYTTLGADSISLTTFGNIGKHGKYSFSFSGNTTIFKCINLQLNGSINYLQFLQMANDKPLRKQGLTYSLLTSVSWRTKGWRASSNAGYTAPNILLQGKSAGYFSNNISLVRQFSKNRKTTISITIHSPFQKHRHVYTEINNPVFYQLRQSHAIVRKYTLSLHYRFGKIKGVTQGK